MTRFRKRLLLVEDAPDNREMLHYMLSEHFEVTAFGSCGEAMADVEVNPPSLLVMDIALPEINGVECLQRIRAIPGLAKIPAVAVTAFAYPEDKARFLAAGFQAVIVKPIHDPKEFLRVIRSLTD